MTAAYRSLLIRCLAIAGALVGVAVSSAPQPEDEVYAITDVRVTDNRQAVRDNSSFLPDHTGVTRHHVTLPYVPGDPGTGGRRRTGYDVNRGIGGSTTTIWVKYERLPRNSSKEVLADIAVAHWTHWRYDAPDGEFRRAGGESGGIQGALTTGTKGSCWRNGLVVKFKPLKDISTWVLGLYLHCTQNNVPWVASIDTIEGIPVTAQRAGIDIHRGCGGSYYFLIKLSATTSLPTHGRTYVWRDLYEGDFHGGYRQIRAFHYAGRAFLLGSKLEGDPPRRVFYVSRVSPDGQGWDKNMGTFDLPRCSDEVRWPRQSWALFYLDAHPHLAAMHRYDDQWRCSILKYNSDTATFRFIGETGFTNWHPTYREQPYIIPLQLQDDPHLLVGSSEQPEQAFRVYRIRDVYKVDDADTAAIADTWEHAVDFGEAGRLDVPSMMRLETIAAFQLDDATHLFGLSHDTNKASIWRLNDETWAFTKTADAPFPAETVLVVAFHADGHPYLFSLDRERETGNIWRINDGADGWERVYWADHRVRFADTGYYRRACTIFELYGHPHMFIQWWTHRTEEGEHPAYIVRFERRNWVRLVNKGAYDAKFYVQYKEDGKVLTWASDRQNTGYDKVVHLPAETRTVLLNAQAHTGFGWKGIIRKDVAVNSTYTVGGSLFGPWCRVTDAAGQPASH